MAIIGERWRSEEGEKWQISAGSATVGDQC
jgi:hypothetical protein